VGRRSHLLCKLGWVIVTAFSISAIVMVVFVAIGMAMIGRLCCVRRPEQFEAVIVGIIANEPTRILAGLDFERHHCTAVQMMTAGCHRLCLRTTAAAAVVRGECLDLPTTNLAQWQRGDALVIPDVLGIMRASSQQIRGIVLSCSSSSCVYS